MEFYRRWTPLVVERIEEALHEGKFLRGIRDGDTTLTLEEKVVVAMATFFLEAHREEIEEGKRDVTTQENAEAVSSQGDEPPEEEEFEEDDEEEPEEVSTGRLF